MRSHTESIKIFSRFSSVIQLPLFKFWIALGPPVTKAAAGQWPGPGPRAPQYVVCGRRGLDGPSKGRCHNYVHISPGYESKEWAHAHGCHHVAERGGLVVQARVREPQKNTKRTNWRGLCHGTQLWLRKSEPEKF